MTSKFILLTLILLGLSACDTTEVCDDAKRDTIVEYHEPSLERSYYEYADTEADFIDQNGNSYVVSLTRKDTIKKVPYMIPCTTNRNLLVDQDLDLVGRYYALIGDGFPRVNISLFPRLYSEYRVLHTHDAILIEVDNAIQSKAMEISLEEPNDPILNLDILNEDYPIEQFVKIELNGQVYYDILSNITNGADRYKFYYSELSGLIGIEDLKTGTLFSRSDY